jgi:uncharacterized membrane protein YqaE (UPF0057 family)
LDPLSIIQQHSASMNNDSRSKKGTLVFMLTVLLPPLGIYICMKDYAVGEHAIGSGFAHLNICIGLTFLLYLPGLVYALIYWHKTYVQGIII